MSGPSQLHETIINDVWEIFQKEVVAEFGNAFQKHGILFGIDIIGARYAVGVTGIGNRIADFYFDPNDGHGFVVGEVGEMKSNKWADVDAVDGAPIRVLRIGFDRSVGIMNPRFSEREVKIVKILQNELWTIRFENEI